MWVLPKFAPIFAALGDNLPWATRVLIGTSTFASEYWYVVVAALLAAVVGFRLFLRDPAGRYKWDKFKLDVPVVGGITRRAALAQICRSFALTLEAGLPVIQALGTIARATGNEYPDGARARAARRRRARRGPIPHVADSGTFTPLALQMIAIGEETGALGEMLDEVANFYEREVDYDLENLSAAIEPILIVAVGAMVTVLALGVFSAVVGPRRQRRRPRLSRGTFDAAGDRFDGLRLEPVHGYDGRIEQSPALRNARKQRASSRSCWLPCGGDHSSAARH